MTNHERKHLPADMAGLDGLIELLRADLPEVLCEKHWMVDFDAVEAQRVEAATQLQALAYRIEALEAENERLRLDVEAQEALQVSAYHAGLKAGWNFCVDDNHEGQQAAMASTDHIKELRRIREARAALGESHD